MLLVVVIAAFKPIYLVGVAFVLLTIYVVGVTLRNDVARGKVCPDCDERVRKDANVCKHCGYRFDASPAGA